MNIPLEDLELNEGADMRFVPQDDVLDREFAFNIREVFEQYFQEHTKN